MINLIRNELTKIFSKKAIYIYSIIIFAILVGMSMLAKKVENSTAISDSFVEVLEDNLGNYDLSNPQELEMYIGDRVLIDAYNLTRNYEYESLEYYYIDNTIEPLIHEKYSLEYVKKDVEGAKKVQEEIDNEIKKLGNLDWKQELIDDKKDIEEEIKSYEDVLDIDKNNEDVKLLLEDAKLRLWCVQYRIDNNVSYSYSELSNEVDNYYDYATKYASIVKDESKIKDKSELNRKREIESNYKESLYKLEHNMVSENQFMLDFIPDSMAYVDGLIIVAILIICGSIISEEFNKGTIKQLLTKPFSRAKILTSKMIAGLIAVTIFVIVYEIVFTIANCYEYSDFTSIFGNTVVYDFNLGKVREVSILSQCIYGFISVLPAYLIMFAIVFFIGVLTTNSVSTICTGFGIFIFYDLLGSWLSSKVLSFIPFYTWDLTPYMYGGVSSNQYATFGKSLFIDILTFVVFIVGSYIIFKRKDIKNQ